MAQILDVLDPGAALRQVAEGLAEYPLLATHLGGVGGRIGERGSVAVVFRLEVAGEPEVVPLVARVGGAGRAVGSVGECGGREDQAGASTPARRAKRPCRAGASDCVSCWTASRVMRSCMKVSTCMGAVGKRELEITRNCRPVPTLAPSTTAKSSQVDAALGLQVPVRRRSGAASSCPSQRSRTSPAPMHRKTPPPRTKVKA